MEQKTILLVENEEIIAIPHIDFLKQCGYNVLFASSSKIAWDLLKSNSMIQLILMDIELGEEIDGTELAKSILKEHDLPILFLSNFTDQETKNKAKQVSSYGFILKSSALPILDTSVELALNLFAEKQKSKEKDKILKQTSDKLKKAYLDVLQRQFAIDQHAIVAITNIAGKILYVNNLFCEISQYSYHELIGKTHRIVNSGYHPTEFWTNMYSCLKAGKVWHGEIRNRAKDGSIYWVATTIAPLQAEKGEIVEYLAIRTVITKRVQAEEELRNYQSELEKQKKELEKAYEELEITQVRYYDLYDFAPVGYLTIDEDGMIEEANLTFGVMIGITRTALLKSSIYQFVYREDQIICKVYRNQLFQTGDPQSFEVRIQRNDGTKFWAKLDTTLRKDEKGASKCRVAVTDFSKSKDLEMQLHGSMKNLEQLNKTKDKFFNIIAHDLRNPFSGIIGIADLLEGKIKEDENNLNPYYLQYTQMIQTTSKSAFGLLENLLLWARSQSGEIKTNPTKIDMKHLISFTIPIIEGNAFKKNIEIETIVADNVIVCADEFFVSTILRNLLTNAIKFTYPFGKILISTAHNDNYLEISITDSGVGIDEKHLDTIFRIDSKVSKQGTANEKGTGLGLILCKDFVEKQGGKIWVTSKLGLGSTFTFTLPLANKKLLNV